MSLCRVAVGSVAPVHHISTNCVKQPAVHHGDCRLSSQHIRSPSILQKCKTNNDDYFCCLHAAVAPWTLLRVCWVSCCLVVTLRPSQAKPARPFAWLDHLLLGPSTLYCWGWGRRRHWPNLQQSSGAQVPFRFVMPLACSGSRWHGGEGWYPGVAADRHISGCRSLLSGCMCTFQLVDGHLWFPDFTAGWWFTAANTAGELCHRQAALQDKSLPQTSPRPRHELS
jgi:hypothetical protein